MYLVYATSLRKPSLNCFGRLDVLKSAFGFSEKAFRHGSIEMSLLEKKNTQPCFKRLLVHFNGI